jgi:hypothetical protein
MIVFDIQCDSGHRFEGWFSSVEDYDGQRRRGLLSCPSCGSEAVGRVPSATRINVGAGARDLDTGPGRAAVSSRAAPADPFARAQKLYSRFLDEVLTKSEDLGTRFPDEARKIHNNEAPARLIRGVATAEEHAALVDEGIPVARLPVPSKGEMN